MFILRSLIFNILFYGLTAFVCIVFVIAIIFPRPVILAVTKGYMSCVKFLETYILDLTYEVRGQEYLPKSGTYLVASKHQSAYETLKLYHLFGDPTIVLKQELMDIPLFGAFLKKLDVIAIDRRNKEASMKALEDGALRMQKQNRPIVIFPQGTRVPVNVSSKKARYKGGIMKIYNTTNLPIIPLALNSGMFWGRKSFLKRPGKVIFEFLPPIKSGLEDKEVMLIMEDSIETHTLALMKEAKEKYPYLEEIKLLETDQAS